MSPSPYAPPARPRLWRGWLLDLGWTPWPTMHPCLRPRRSSRSSTPTTPSAPILGLLLRPTDCAKEPLDGLLHLFPNHVADHSDQTLPSRHATSFAQTPSDFANARMVAVERFANISPSPSKATAVLGG